MYPEQGRKELWGSVGLQAGFSEEDAEVEFGVFSGIDTFEEGGRGGLGPQKKPNCSAVPTKPQLARCGALERTGLL